MFNDSSSFFSQFARSPLQRFPPVGKATGTDPRRALIEPPFHLEGHRYQTVQAADWIAALIGRLGAYWVEPAVWPENEVFQRYYGERLKQVHVRSGIRREGTLG